MGCDACGRRTRHGVSLFRYSEKTKRPWEKFVVAATGVKKFVSNKNSRLCHLHFRRDEVVTTITANGIRRSLKDQPNPCIYAASLIKRRKSKKALDSVVDDENTENEIAEEHSEGDGPLAFSHAEPVSALLLHPLHVDSPALAPLETSSSVHDNSYDYECHVEFSPDFQECSNVEAVSEGYQCNSIAENESTVRILISGCKSPIHLLECSGLMDKENAKESNVRTIVHVAGSKFPEGLPALPLDGERSRVKVMRQMTKRQATVWQDHNFEDLNPWEIIYKLMDKNEDAEKKLQKAEQGLSKFLPRQQVGLVMEDRDLRRNNRRWTEESIRDGLLKKSVWGRRGYEISIEGNMPYPSTRTLQKRVRHLQFEPGVQEVLIEGLSKKLQSMEGADVASYAILSFDEITHKAGIEFDPSTHKNIGFISPELSKLLESECLKTPASKLMLYVLRGVCHHWKQIVGFHFTGKSIDADKMQECLVQLVQTCHQHNITVIGIVSDMSSDNQALWRQLGVYANNISDNVLVPHPSNSDDYIVFMDDPTHAMKNFKNALMKYKIRVPTWFLDKHELSSTTEPISVLSLLEKMLDIQESDGSNLTASKKLSREHLQPSNWEKMRVGFTLAVINDRVAAAVQICAKDGSLPHDEAMLAACLIRWIATWYSIISARSKSQSLAKPAENAAERPPEFDDMNWMSSDERVEFLQLSTKLFRELIFDDFGKRWHPCQTGLILSTQGILKMRDITVLNPKCPISYLLPSRGSSEPCENAFSEARRKTGEPNPGSLKLVQLLRIMSVTQSIKLPRNCSYMDGGDETALVLSNTGPPPKKKNPDLDLSPLEKDEYGTLMMKNLTENVLYHLSSWVVKKLLMCTKLKSCQTCCTFLKVETNQPNDRRRTALTEIINKGRLTFASDSFADFIVAAETFFLALNSTTAGKSRYTTFAAPEETLAEAFLAHPRHEKVLSTIPECHKDILAPLALKKFFRSRLNRELKVDRVASKANQAQQYAGKIVTMESSGAVSRKRKHSNTASTVTEQNVRAEEEIVDDVEPDELLAKRIRTDPPSTVSVLLPNSSHHSTPLSADDLQWAKSYFSRIVIHWSREDASFKNLLDDNIESYSTKNPREYAKLIVNLKNVSC